jgi:hypothetical protein
MLKDMNSKPKKLMRRLAKLSEHLLEFPTCSFFHLKSAHVFYFILLRLELKKKKKTVMQSNWLCREKQNPLWY